MIWQEEWMEIHLLRRQGMSISQIAHQPGHTRKTIRKYLRRGEVPSYRPRKLRPTILDPYKDMLVNLFHSGVHNGVVLYEKISDLGYPGSYDSVKRLVAPLREQVKTRDATIRFETDPGDQSQVDWGHFEVLFEKTGQRQWMYLFIMLLGWSRFCAGCKHDK